MNVETSTLSRINPENLTEEKIRQFKESFDNGIPYRHLAMDNFLEAGFADTLLKNFPGPEQMRRHYDGLNEKKSEGSNFDHYHESFGRLREMLLSDELTEFLGKITGIKDLKMPDDHRGAGVHQGSNGSFLDIHVDFSIHPVLNTHRRLNLLIFFNEGWQEDWGGALELWDKEVQNCGARILPIFNRAVIFETSDISWHGYDEITVPEGVKRNSFFSYFYTPIEDGSNVKYHDTIFKTRPDEGNAKKIKTAAKEGAKNFIKGTMKKVGLNKIFDKFE